MIYIADEERMLHLRILVLYIVENFSTFLTKGSHVHALDILQYDFDPTKLLWRSDKCGLDSGIYLMIHMERFYGQLFNFDLGKPFKRRVHGAEVCSKLLLPDINE